MPTDKKGQSGAHGRPELPRTAIPDPDKVVAAEIFKKRWDAAKAHPAYVRQKADFVARYGK